MADDARISTALPNHPKMLKLEKRLGALGAWSLIKLFLWVADNRHDGNLAGMTDEDIEIAVRWSGSDGQFVSALRDVGFLDGEPTEYLVHKWEEHNPFAATKAKRVAAAKRANSVRWEQRLGRWQERIGSASDTTRMRPGSASDESGIPSTPLLSTPPKPTIDELAARDASLEVCSRLSMSGHREPVWVGRALPQICKEYSFTHRDAVEFLVKAWNEYERSDTRAKFGFENWLGQAKWKQARGSPEDKLPNVNELRAQQRKQAALVGG